MLRLTALGATRRLTEAVLDQYGHPFPLPVTWAISDPTVASLATFGDTALVTALTNGTATINATAGDLQAQIVVQVVQTPDSVVIMSGGNQQATVHTTLPLPLRVRVLDSLGSPVTGAPISFVVLRGNGYVATPQRQTDSVGSAETLFTLGDSAGPVNVIGAGLSPIHIAVMFKAIGEPGPPVSIVPASPTTRRGQVSLPLGAPITVAVLDAYANAVSGVPVSFTVTAGGGTLASPSTSTGPDGIASSSWTLGPAAGANEAQAVTPALAAPPITFRVTAVSTPFFIDVRFLRPVPDSIRQAFDEAASSWEALITSDLAPIDFRVSPILPGSCGPESPGIDEVVDDILVFVDIVPIDGPGNLNGWSGPCFIRIAGGLPIVGLVQLDSADVDRLWAFGSLRPWVRHELGHALGFGTLWSVPGYFDCLHLPSGPTGILDTYFGCPKAVAMFWSLRTSGPYVGNVVPVENCDALAPLDCRAGFANTHWRNWLMAGELMTGWLGPGSTLSRLTAAAMEDLGYGINYGAADSTFVIPAPPAGEIAGAPLAVGDDVYHGPVRAVDASGRGARSPVHRATAASR